MKEKNFFQILDYTILVLIIIFAAAMSGISLRFTLSATDIVNQTSTLVPDVAKSTQQTLQFNALKIKTTKTPSPDQIPFECPARPQNFQSVNSVDSIKQVPVYQ